MNLKRRMAALLLAAVLAGCCGCEKPHRKDEEKALSGYLNCWEQQDYADMYAHCDPATQRLYTQEEFELLHREIYEQLDVRQIMLHPAGDMRKGEGRAYQTVAVTYVLPEEPSLQFETEAALLVQGTKWYLRWDPEQILPGFAEGDELRTVTTEGRRGEIFSADGVLLAKNGYASTVYAVLSAIGDVQDTARKMGEVTGQTEQEIADLLTGSQAQRDGLAIIKAYPAGTLTKEEREKLTAIVGVRIDEEKYTSQRIYPEGSLLAHTLGTVGLISEQEMESLDPERYDADDRIGKSGLEAAFEDVLHPGKGREIRLYDADGRLKSTLLKVPAMDGQDLILSIDVKLQKRAEELLQTMVSDEDAGAVVVTDPKTGAVQALASFPTFDPNRFSIGMSQSEWDALGGEGQNQPLFNRALQGLYPPGSTIKPFTAAIGMETGAIDRDHVFEGTIVDRKWTPKGWAYSPITRHTNYAPPYDLRASMLHSDNIYYADVALKVGAQAFAEGLDRLGFGSAVPFDLYVTPARYSNSDAIENESFLADCGYGQGEMVISPLQLNVLFSCFANGGSAMAPYIVEKRGQTETDGSYRTVWERQPALYVENAVSPDSLSVLLPILRAVVTDGTGYECAPEGMQIAGKTGTAQIGTEKKHEISWFAGFVADDSLDRAVCVMIDAADGDTSARSPISREMFLP